MKYKIEITQTAFKMLKGIQRDIRQKIEKRIDELSENPENQGKPLIGELTRFRSVHAAGRYRVLYLIDHERVIVVVVAVGIRKNGDKRDIYTLAKKIMKSGLLK